MHHISIGVHASLREVEVNSYAVTGGPDRCAMTLIGSRGESIEIRMASEDLALIVRAAVGWSTRAAEATRVCVEAPT